MTARVTWLVTATLVVAACGGSQHPRGEGNAIVRIRSSQADAGIWIDDRYIGAVSAYPAGLSIKPGAHRLEVRHDDFFTRYFDLALAPREQRMIDVDFAPLLP